MLEGQGFYLPPARYQVKTVGRLIDQAVAPCEDGQADYLVAAEYAFGPYLADPARHPGESAAYARVFQRATLAATFKASGTTVGGQLRIYKCSGAVRNQ
jgi:hypothetical protein